MSKRSRPKPLNKEERRYRWWLIQRSPEGVAACRSLATQIERDMLEGVVWANWPPRGLVVRESLDVF